MRTEQVPSLQQYLRSRSQHSVRGSHRTLLHELRDWRLWLCRLCKNLGHQRVSALQCYTVRRVHLRHKRPKQLRHEHMRVCIQPSAQHRSNEILLPSGVPHQRPFIQAVYPHLDHYSTQYDHSSRSVLQNSYQIDSFGIVDIWRIRSVVQLMSLWTGVSLRDFGGKWLPTYTV